MSVAALNWALVRLGVPRDMRRRGPYGQTDAEKSVPNRLAKTLDDLPSALQNSPASLAAR